jgi:hypothetical protein
MEPRPNSHSIQLRWKRSACGESAIAATLSLAALLMTPQLAAQNRIFGDSVDPVQPEAGLQPAPTSHNRTGLRQISAPDPVREDASLVRSQAIPFLALEAQDSSQSSSQSGVMNPTPTQTKASRTKPPHRGLGIALAVVGTTTLAVGITLDRLSNTAVCGAGETECRHLGIALMPVGGAVAVTGFYLTFHR